MIATGHPRSIPFKEYAQVIIDKDGLDGTVVDAEYVEGHAHHYSITYTVKSDRDNSLKELWLLRSSL